MQCPECGAKVESSVVFCPSCGGRPEPFPSAPSPVAEFAEPGSKRACANWVLIVAVGGIIALIIAALVLAGAVWTGYKQGEKDWRQNAQSTAEAMYTRCQGHQANGEWELAAAACREAARLADYPELREQGLHGYQTAQAELRPKPTPTLQIVVEAAKDVFEQAQARFDDQDWNGAIELLNKLWGMDANYSAEQVAEMRRTSFIALGQQMLEQDDLEMAVYYLDQAAVFGSLPSELETERQLAACYMSALNMLGVNWELAIERFAGLYNTYPGYRDVFARLVQAHLDWADSAADRLDWCPAETRYTEALVLRPDPQVESRRVKAAEQCLLATPTPLPGAGPISGTVLPPQLEPIEGFNVGRLAYTAYNPDSGMFELFSRYADGRLVRMGAGGSQPAWRRDGTLLAFRSGAGGIQATYPEGGLALSPVADATAAWPTWSPDGARLAYAVREGDGWRIYVVPADGSGAPQLLTVGWSPAWGPTGAFVFSGCVVDGIIKGICAIDPNDPDTGATPLTSDQRDTPVGWSPDGNWILYMSPYDGDWDIYMVHVQGAVVQLTTDAGADGAPAWSPDGSSIAFISNRDGAWGVYLMNTDGGNQRKIINLGDNYLELGSQRLSWSP